MKAATYLGGLFLTGLLAGTAQAGTIKSDVYGVMKNGATVHVFTMTNNHGMRAQVLDLGGIICDVEAPGRDGKLANVILCQKDLAGIEATGPMSALTGRYANRIGHGFTLDGKHYDLQANPAGVTLHGGRPGYSTRILTVQNTFQHASDAGVTFRLVSPDGDQGFPGTVTIDVTYTLTDNNDFRIDYKATTDKDTVINLTNHTYYNLAGNGAGNVENQVMTLMSDEITPTDQYQVPLGTVASVAGTPFDFREPTPIGKNLRSSDPQRVLRAYEVFESTGRPLAEWQDAPGEPVLKDLKLAAFVLDPSRDVRRALIAQRFEKMLDTGALDEARALEDLDPGLPAAKLLGLRPLQALAKGTLTRTEALDGAITATRQFAKRQMTWFRHRMPHYIWYDPSVSNLITQFRQISA